jgi:hypothetical protein
MGTGALIDDSDEVGSNVGVVAVESVLDEDEGALVTFGLADRGGLLSCLTLFLRERLPDTIDEALDEVLVLARGRVGEVSRDCRGDAAADDEADVWGTTLDGCEDCVSVFGVKVIVDSRDRVGVVLGSLAFRLGSGEPFAMLDDLSIIALMEEIRIEVEESGRVQISHARVACLRFVVSFTRWV